ncbi:hypothetical protein QZH41_000943 [Actinostola sp. cb2023]|nr:hypothetical protein QZH41_000943 [Actinostola sp. cb2023]
MNSTESNLTYAELLRREFASRSRTEIIVSSSTLIFINALALFGNTMVVIAFLWKPRLRNITNTFIIALCLSDILMALFPMPMSAGALMLGEWPYNDISCTVQGFLVNFLAFVSLQIMALTAVNRFYKIKKPLRCNIIFTYRSTVLMISAACLVSLGVSISLVFTTTDRVFLFHPGKIICVPGNMGLYYSLIYTTLSSLFFVVLPATVIVICYTKVFRKLRKHNQQLHRRVGQHPNALNIRRESKMRRSEITISRTLFGTVLGFFVCWIPCFGIDIADVMISDNLDRRVYLVYMYLAYTSSAINPLIYGILNPSFRREFFNVLSCKNGREISG